MAQVVGRRRLRLGATLLLLCGVAAGCAPPRPTAELDLTRIAALAEARTETEAIDFGAPEARVFLLEGWSFNQTLPDGKRFVWGLGDRSLLGIVFGEPRDLRLRFLCRPGAHEGEGATTLSVRVAGRVVGETALRPGPAWYSVPLPGALLGAGENRIEFLYGFGERDAAPSPEDRSVAFERLEVVGAASFGLPGLRAGGAGPSLRIPFRSSLAYYWMLPEGGELALPELTSWPSGAAGHLEVEVQQAGAPAPVRTVLSPGRGEQRVDLPAAPGGPVRVVLRAVLDSEPPELPAGLDLVSPVLRTPAATGGDAAALAARAAAETPPDVFVYMIDTLRPDHLGAYGYPRPTSPNIDAFASDATLFLDAVAQTSWTRPAVASVFTGLHPRSHGVVRANVALARDLPVLPEVLRGLGFQTWGVITNGNVAPAFGFARGFDRYRYLPEGQPGEMHQLSDAVNEVGFRWLDARKRKGPLFLYLHTSDPHSPYTPRSPYREALAAGVHDPDAGSRPYMRRLQLGEPASQGTQEDVRALYDAEIAFNDASFGAFIEKLKELDLYASSLIILLSDHGEAFAEHGSWQHGTTLYDEVVSIPLVIRFPQGVGAGRVVATTARQVDVLPTILDVLGEDPLPGLEGRSLLPDVVGNGAPAPPVTAFSHLARRRGEWVSASQGHRKLIRTAAASDGAEYVRLFDLELDPKERHDVAPYRPVWRGYLLSQLRHLESVPRRDEDAPAADIDPELQERLEALGYM